MIYRFRGAGRSLAFTLCEIHGTLYCATAAQLNDPFDGIGSAHNEAGVLQLSGQPIPINQHWTAACFTERWDSPTMWAHYSENFNGVCLAYELDGFANKARAGAAAFGTPFVQSGAKCHFDKVQYFDDMPTAFSDYREALFAKTSDWKYEKEWRLGIQFPGTINGVEAGVSVGIEGMLKQILVGTNIESATLNCIRLARDAVDRSIEIRRVKHASGRPGYELGATVG